LLTVWLIYKRVILGQINGVFGLPGCLPDMQRERSPYPPPAEVSPGNLPGECRVRRLNSV
jgi:hypothetical protein